MSNIRCLFLLMLVFIGLAIPSSCGGGGGGGARIQPPANGGTNNPPDGGGTTGIAQSPGEVGGVIRDANGVVVPELEVYLDAIQNFVASTNSNGEFLISGVNSGQHTLYFGVEGEEVTSFVFTYDSSAPLNLTLQREMRSVSQVGAEGTLTGTVTDTAGSPIEDVRVLIFDRSGFFLIDFTNASGVYTLNEVPVGEYFLLGFKRGYRTHIGQVSITENQTTTHDFVMGRQPTGSINGTVTSTSSVPLSRTHVFLIYNDRDPNLSAPPSFQVLTDAQGKYSFDVVPVGSAYLLVFKPEFTPESRSVTIPAGEVITENFVLTLAGQTPPPPPGAGGTISGQVLRDEDDRSLHGTGARVFLYNGQPSETNPPIQRTESNENGEFRFAGVAPSRDQLYFIVAEKIRHDELWRGSTSTALFEGEVVQITVIIRPTQNVQPTSGTASLSGKIFGGDGAVAGAQVELKRGDNAFETFTGEDGSYSFSGIPAGFYEYEVHAAGFNELEGEIFLEDGENHRDFFLLEGVPSGGEGGVISGVVFKLKSHRSASGTNEDESGDDDGIDNGGDDNGGGDDEDEVDEMEPADATVRLYLGDPSAGGQLIATVESGEDGFYKFLGVLPSGETPYFIVAEKDEDGVHYRGVAQTFLMDGEIVRINVVMVATS